MTDVKTHGPVKRYRVASISGAVLGACLLIGYFAYESAMTPAKPIISTAKANEVVEYISNERGLTNLSQIEQEQFLEQWREHVTKPEAKQDLKACFDNMDDGARKRFADAIFKHVKRAFVADAKQFSRLATQQEKNSFIRKKVVEIRQQGLFAKEVAGAFKSDLPKGQDDFRQWALENTTAEERAIAEPYADALKRVGEITRKEERAGQTASAPQ